MKNTMLLTSLLIASSSVFAGQDLVEGLAQQGAKNAATSVAPAVVERTAEAGELVEKAKTVEMTPEAVKESAKENATEAAKEKLEEATPEEAKQGVKAIETGHEKAEKMKGEVADLPKTPAKVTQSIKGKAKTKVRATTAKKAMDLMH